MKKVIEAAVLGGVGEKDEEWWHEISLDRLLFRIGPAVLEGRGGHENI